jgi:hypothetical protein
VYSRIAMILDNKNGTIRFVEMLTNKALDGENHPGLLYELVK